ncbi:2-alkenal reductase [Alicyclobacillus contaminans]|uniref:S1C family serine protease n=1 Tax=Alicyclobacillus contaminans TaxID=392016 RepID=UPI00041037C9|nr:trypsin-like peptidase domain-containing protein [Alicyclobacillus contaminans]GMA49590.1 2-alkenal reductase [Alicyclobacillus contaminans]
MAKRWHDEGDWAFGSSRRSSRGPWLVATAAVCFAIGVLAGASWFPRTVYVGLDSAASGGGNSSSTQGSQNGLASGSEPSAVPPELGNNVITQIYDASRPSIVTITAVSGTSAAKDGLQEDVGTGFFIDNSGDIATNNHVVNGQSSVSVSVNGKTYKAKVVGTDALDDLAVVRLTPMPANVKPLPLGTASTLHPGDLVVAIGNPFELTASVSAGIVSGLNRSMPTDNGRLLSGLVQTDAALNPGNSGGPLLNASGQVIGINTAIESPVEGSVGIGFAIPIDKLKQVLPNLLSGKAVDHPWLGITGMDITPKEVETYHLPVNQGVLVITTTKGGPAQRAGIHGDSGSAEKPVGDGDIITAANGQSVADLESLTSIISSLQVGDVVHLSILRHGTSMDISVTLQAWPKNGP